MHELKLIDMNVEMARKCLGLIRDIADRGASSWDPNDVGYALQELSQVLLERTGTKDRIFEPVPADELRDLAALYAKLEFVDGMLFEISMQFTDVTEIRPTLRRVQADVAVSTPVCASLPKGGTFVAQPGRPRAQRGALGCGDWPTVAQKQKNPPRECRAGEGGGSVRCYLLRR